MSLSVLHYSGLSLISLLDSLSGSYFTINLSSFPETETVCQLSCLLFQHMYVPCRCGKVHRHGSMVSNDQHDGHACACAGVWQAMAMPALLACDYMPMHPVGHGAMCATAVMCMTCCSCRCVGTYCHDPFPMLSPI